MAAAMVHGMAVDRRRRMPFGDHLGHRMGDLIIPMTGRIKSTVI